MVGVCGRDGDPGRAKSHIEKVDPVTGGVSDPLWWGALQGL